MANICDTQYKVMGERKAVADLWDTLLTMEVNTKNVSLNRLAEHYGIDYEKMGISVRGHIYWAEFEEDDDICLLSFDTECVWAACDQFFEELNNTLGGELSISYREIECGCNLFYVHDEQGFFPEECCVSSSGEPFEDACEDVFDLVRMRLLSGVRKQEYRKATEQRMKWWSSSMAMSMMMKTPIII